MPVLTARTVAPFAAMGATWIARKGLSSAYARRTGHVPPKADDTEVSIVSVLAWALTTAVVSAAIEVIITRIAAEMTDSQEVSSFKEQDAVTG
ncbi:MAG: DUF4235 domain-containing protein [Candidatus Nanopelagicales bacterium]